MAQVNTHIDPRSTSGVLANLSLAIDEIKLLRSIDRLKEQLRLADTLLIDADRRHYLVAEMRILNKRLMTLRKRVTVQHRRDALAGRADADI